MGVIATDLPDPVVPATSRCGMRAEIHNNRAPEISLPAPAAAWHRRPRKFRSRSFRAGKRFSRVVLGSSIPMALRPGNDGDAGGNRAHRTRDVVGQADNAAGFRARDGSSSYNVTTAGADFDGCRRGRRNPATALKQLGVLCERPFRLTLFLRF